MHVQLNNLCTDLLKQCRRTHVIKRLASVSRTFLPHLRSSMPAQRQRSRLTTDELARAMGKLECGSSQRRVANVFGVSQRGLTRAWNCFQTYGSATQRHPGGRQRATTPREDLFLVVQATRHPFVNATTLRNDFGNAVGVNISTQAVRNRLQQSGLRSRKACIRISLTRLHTGASGQDIRSQ